MSENKCCGNCKHFNSEDVGGWGWCSFNKTKTHCAQSWDCHNNAFNGWTEITPDNVDEVRKIDAGRITIAYMNNNGYVLYGLRMSLDFMSKHGGYYFFILPELKIEK